mmetsp:Transcript_141920/g.369904  ORF Transcript_141920/g.369904 Transcript_141920/m.369904 type:complete len:200 (-) Transcript_141920:1-600(-)
MKDFRCDVLPSLPSLAIFLPKLNVLQLEKSGFALLSRFFKFEDIDMNDAFVANVRQLVLADLNSEGFSKSAMLSVSSSASSLYLSLSVPLSGECMHSNFCNVLRSSSLVKPPGQDSSCSCVASRFWSPFWSSRSIGAGSSNGLTGVSSSNSPESMLFASLAIGCGRGMKAGKTPFGFAIVWFAGRLAWAPQHQLCQSQA